jgi:hypothetical protein
MSPSGGTPHALILAGGLDLRLKPFTFAIPKPLIPLEQRAMTEVILRQLGGAARRSRPWRCRHDRCRRAPRARPPYGNLKTDGGEGFRGWSEEQAVCRLVSGGIYVLEPALLDLVHPGERPTWPTWLAAHRGAAPASPSRNTTAPGSTSATSKPRRLLWLRQF